MDRKSYYSVLDVPSSATQEQVQAAYKRLALLHHPDRSCDPQATRQMQLLNEAYEVLSSAERRAWYDREQAASNPPAEAEEVPPAGEKPPPAKQAASQQQDAPQQQPKATTKEQEERANTRRAWMIAQLKFLLGLSFLLLVLFFLSLITGQVSLVAITLVVLTAVGMIVSIVRKIRNPAL